MSELFHNTKLEKILEMHSGQKGALIPILQEIQAAYGYLPEEALKMVSRRVKVPLSRIYGVISFYAQFYLTPRGKHLIKACQGTACHVRGASQVLDNLSRELKVNPGGTTEDLSFSLETAVSLLRDGRVFATYDKQLLPNYSVFDEMRYFAPGEGACVVEIAGVPVGITVCEDIWQPDPVRQAVDAGARLIVTVNASPYHMGKGREREEVVQARVRETGAALVYVNLVGGQDELVFDGGSFVMDCGGSVSQRCAVFGEELALVELVREGEHMVPQSVSLPPPLDLEDQVYRALVLGVRDYVDKIQNLSQGHLLEKIDITIFVTSAVCGVDSGGQKTLVSPSSPIDASPHTLSRWGIRSIVGLHFRRILGSLLPKLELMAFFPHSHSLAITVWMLRMCVRMSED